MRRNPQTKYCNGSDSHGRDGFERIAELISEAMARSSVKDEKVEGEEQQVCSDNDYKNPGQRGPKLDQLDISIIGALQHWGKCSPRILGQIANASPPTLHRHLKRLLGCGYVKKSGSTRAARYWLTSAGKAALKNRTG